MGGRPCHMWARPLRNPPRGGRRRQAWATMATTARATTTRSSTYPGCGVILRTQASRRCTGTWPSAAGSPTTSFRPAASTCALPSLSRRCRARTLRATRTAPTQWAPSRTRAATWFAWGRSSLTRSRTTGTSTLSSARRTSATTAGSRASRRSSAPSSRGRLTCGTTRTRASRTTSSAQWCARASRTSRWSRSSRGCTSSTGCATTSPSPSRS
mmetsp:Transcript_45037/g.111600  ORF Transcript_45037/g.111600 Transcript_45037/m.111600 type:complete len:213 (+) Transcript_45037:725-1363(+)